MIKKITSVLMCLLMIIYGTIPAAAAAAAGQASGSGLPEAQKKGQVKTPENPMAENVLKYDQLVQKGKTYDSSGLLTYKIENGSAVIMSCDPVIKGELYIPETIEGMPVTAINNYAFLYCANMTSVNIPAAVTKVGDYAFCYCTGLASVKMGGSSAAAVSIGKYAFYRCYDLKDLEYVTIGEIGDYAMAYTGLDAASFKNGLKKIGSYAFEGCDNLKTLTLPEGVTSIGEFAFCRCASLTSVKLPSSLGLDGTGGYLFYDCDALKTVAVPSSWTRIPEGILAECASADCMSLLHEGITEIGKAAFYHCDTLPSDLVIPSTVKIIDDFALQCVYGKGVKSVKLPEGLVKIGADNFYCAQLTEIKLPSTLEEIGDEAFLRQNISGTLELSGNIKKIGASAFEGTKISELKIGKNLLSIGSQAFSNCENLEKVNIADDYTGDGKDWGSSVFLNCRRLSSINIPSSFRVIPDGLLRTDTLISEISIPDSVTEIGEYAFLKCTALKSISLPSALEKIGAYAFDSSGIESVDLPSNIKEIEESAFANTSIKKVYMPDRLEIVGNSAFSSCKSLADVSFGKSLKKIGSSAFEKCTSLKAVDIPSSVTEIGASAFENCSSLTYADLNSCIIEELSGGIFSGCSSLKSIKLPGSLKVLGSGSSIFAGCSSLESIDIPDSVEVIGESAFINCTSLEKIRIPASIKKLSKGAFQKTGINTIIIPSSVDPAVWESDYAYVSRPLFDGCDKLKNVEIPSSWRYIPAGFLMGATGKFTVSLGNNIKEIHDSAFNGCTGMTSISIPDSVVKIEKKAFYNSGLTSIKIPDSVSEENFGKYAIGGCTKLASITLPSTWKNIPEGLFQGNQVLTQYTIPDGIVSIGEAAFEGSMLTEINIPASVTDIGKRAFRNCTGLKTISFSDSLKKIGAYSFSGCTSLTDVTIPGSVELIAENAFEECDSLRTVTIKNGVKTINGLSFGYCDNLTEISIPESVTEISCNAFYGSNPGNVHITTTEDSAAARLAAVTSYINSDWLPRLDGMTFIMSPYSDNDRKSMKIQTNSTNYQVVYNGFTFVVHNDTTIRTSDGYDRWTANYSLETEADLTSYDKGQTVTQIVIPTYVPGSLIPVTELYGNIFAGNPYLMSVTLGDNLKKVGNSAFADCKNLKTVDMSSSMITQISYDAFKNCTSLTTVKWPAALDSILDSAFENCSSLAAVDFSKTKLNKISAKAFLGCSSLSKLVLREGLKWIDNKAFAGSALKNVYIPSTQYVLQPTAFDKGTTYHFTGDATDILYWWQNPTDGGIYYSAVLPLILESRGSRVAQFFGKGLDNQTNYFISTETAGLNIPYGARTADAELNADGMPVGDPSSEAAGDLSAQASGQQSSDTADITDANPIEDAAEKVYEVVRKTVEDGSGLAVIAAAVILSVIAAAGWKRYRKSREQ